MRTASAFTCDKSATIPRICESRAGLGRFFSRMFVYLLIWKLYQIPNAKKSIILFAIFSFPLLTVPHLENRSALFPQRLSCCSCGGAVKSWKVSSSGVSVNTDVSYCGSLEGTDRFGCFYCRVLETGAARSSTLVSQNVRSKALVINDEL